MGKFVMPPVQEFLKNKFYYEPKREQVWVYLEKEMLNNAKKPYNEKVGKWLRFLKDLRYHFHCEAVKKEKRLQKEAGPRWYLELSSQQKQVLSHLKKDIHEDLLEDLPCRLRKDLSDLGITLKIPKRVLMNAMMDSFEDPGVFFWKLYQAVYKMSPSELRQNYDINAMILMSCLVFIDIEECTESLNNITRFEKSTSPPPPRKRKKSIQPEGKYGMYLQKSHPIVPCYTSRKPKKPPTPPSPLGYKLKLKSPQSYENLRKSTVFLEKRLERNKRENQQDSLCNYKFRGPRSSSHNDDPKMAAFLKLQRMLKKKARARFKAPFENIQFLIAGVSYIGGKPQYHVANVATLPTGYIAINDGIVMCNSEAVTCIDGFWKYPNKEIETCDNSCDCLTKWETTVMDYLKGSTCKCGHLYDFYHTETRNNETYFYPPTRHGPFWIDTAKIYQLDPMEDFIKDAFTDAIKSDNVTPQRSVRTMNASGLKESELLEAFLADLSETPLLIPHLPQANLLNNLQEWARNRVKGKLTPKKHRRMLLQSQRRWFDLSRMHYRVPAMRIPYTAKQLKNMNWTHRQLIQKLFHIMLEDFVTRNRIKLVEQSRLWWSTTKYDCNPNKQFLDTFFTYMPGRLKDVHFVNPYSSNATPKNVAKTCPLGNLK